MSKYTTQLRWVVESKTDESLSLSERINQSLPLIFDFDYPIWSEDYRRVLERKIVMRYFTKELCNVYGLWKFFLEERLNTIMPYYNKMYETVSKNYDWLEDVNYTEKYEGNKDVTSNVKDIGSSTIDETNNVINDKTYKGLTSDTPQANFNGEDYASELQEDVSNETNKNIHTGTSSNSTNTDVKNNSKDLYTRTMKGLNGSKSLTQLNLEYRKSLINIDDMIIKELYDLFMLIY